jgi:hypothetical protein
VLNIRNNAQVAVTAYAVVIIRTRGSALVHKDGEVFDAFSQPDFKSLLPPSTERGISLPQRSLGK